MTPAQFDQIIEDQFKQCRQLLSQKAGEYARGDRLSNFKKAANLTGSTPVTALWGMAVKHIVSIADYVNDYEMGDVHTLPQWNEKIHDAINYLLLLKGVLVDGGELEDIN